MQTYNCIIKLSENKEGAGILYDIYEDKMNFYFLICSRALKDKESSNIEYLQEYVD